MTELAYIYDSIRTPRGKRKQGALNEITPTDLLSKFAIVVFVGVLSSFDLRVYFLDNLI